MNRATIARLIGASAAAFIAMAGAPMLTQAGAAASAAPNAFVRGAHFSPDTAAVDVYLTAFSGGTSTLWLSDVGYGDVGPYRQVAAGTYAVSMRPHGAPASQKPALTWTLNLKAGAAYTAAAVGKNAQIRGVVVSDTLNPPPAGTGLVRIIQASSEAGHVAVKAEGGPVLTADTAFGSITGYVAVPSGNWTVQAQSSTQPTLSGTLAVSVRSGSISSVVLLDQRGGGLTLRTVLDAAGAAQMPTGSVPAGGGGTAPHPRSGPDGLISWTALGCAAVALLAGLQSRGRRTASRQ
ncbi:MAG: hypothetical protein QOH54_2078 [Mycobacterium sp.]|nr:hypothetical protein [Mycobacterium sp.]MDX6243315.1 hypothetical protein [Frankiales bacterium]